MAHHRALARHFDDGRRHVVGVRELLFELAFTAEDLTPFGARLLQRALHAVEALLVDQRADQVAFQRMADAYPGIGGLQALDDLGLYRFVGD
ncbi:hypothetical protein D9M70_482150 [compost metagenome]